VTVIDWKERYPDLLDTDYQWTLPENADDLPQEVWRDWLLAPGSLTQRLQRLSDNAFAVEVVEAAWVSATPDYLAALGIQQADAVWSRRVALLGCETPWVVAHSYFASATGRKPPRVGTAIDAVLTLGRQPLGALLFEHPQMQRGPIEICKTRTGWGRRSRFSLDGEPIVVAEYFLEALLHYVTDKQVVPE
jgi:chorismate--pyruvate lyase